MTYRLQQTALSKPHLYQVAYTMKKHLEITFQEKSSIYMCGNYNNN